MSIFTRDDLIEAFNTECFAMDAKLATIAQTEEFAKYPTILQMLDSTFRPTTSSIWWTSSTYARFLNHRVALESELGEDDYDIMVSDAQKQLDFGDGHLDEFEKNMHAISTANPMDCSYYKLLPHTVGKVGDAYGQELRHTDGWKSVNMTCQAIPNINVTIEWVNNPQEPSLRKSFGFALKLQTTDDVAVQPKMRVACERGLIRVCH